MANSIEVEEQSLPTADNPESNPSSLPPHSVLSYPMQELTLEPNRGQSSTEDNLLDKEYFYGPKSASSSVYALHPHGTPSSTNLVAYRDNPDMFQGGQASFLPDYSQQKHGFFASVRKNRRRARIFIGLAVIGLLTLISVIAAFIYMFATKRHQETNSSGNSPGTLALHPAEVTGGDGSTVTRDDGSTFTYNNSFGGTWYYDPADPFNNGARAQSWSPALNETFGYGTDPIRGVNLGGWLVTEPFISPALFEKYLSNDNPAVDEWTLSECMRNDTDGGGISQLENHYKTFVTEDDFAQIAGAGLNFVRIPIPYWAIETRDDEPFLAKTSWTYFLKAIEWARKYGLRINLDLHTLPGSQNGWNHSGRSGSINVLNGPMGYANAQRSLDYIRIIAEFISQPEYKDVVVMFGITNEPQASVVGMDVLKSYYLEGYDIVRTASGVGEGKGPYVSIHDGFMGASEWIGFLPGADRLALDMHKYTCFGPQPTGPFSGMVNVPCEGYASMINNTLADFGLVTAGEFSNAVMDCGLYINGVNVGSRYDGTMSGSTKIGSCDPWLDWAKWDDATKQNYMTLARSSMDSLQNWFFWTWKIGESSVHGTVMSPHWSYQLGLQNGWMPTDPRSAVGTCGNGSPFNGPLKSFQTGGAGAGNIPASATAEISWPPATMSKAGAVSLLPSYTPTGPLVTLPPPTFTASVDAGSGWTNPDDKAGMMVPIVGCSYLDPWVGDAKPPSPLCSAGAVATAAAAKPVVQTMPTSKPTSTSAVLTVAAAVRTSLTNSAKSTSAVTNAKAY